MSVRALDEFHDWTFGGGFNNYLTRNAEVVQDINTRLSMWLGDCFFNNNVGIDWLNLLGSKNLTALNLSISTTILNTDNVVGIQSTSSNFDHQTRNFTVSYTVQSSFSTIITNTYVYSLNGTGS